VLGDCVGVEPTLGGGHEAAVDRGAERPGLRRRPALGQQFGRQQRVLEDRPPVFVDEQDAGDQRVEVGEGGAGVERGGDRRHRRDDAAVALGDVVERPGEHGEPPHRREVAGRREGQYPGEVGAADGWQRGNLAGLRRDGDRRRQRPPARRGERPAQRRPVAARVEHGEAERTGPRVGAAPVDAAGGGGEGGAALAGEPVEAVAADLLALQPAVGGEPRHGGPHDAVADVHGAQDFRQRAEPHHAAARHHGIAEDRDDQRAGARRGGGEAVEQRVEDGRAGHRWGPPVSPGGRSGRSSRRSRRAGARGRRGPPCRGRRSSRRWRGSTR
jgi:hypothetical protein